MNADEYSAMGRIAKRQAAQDFILRHLAGITVVWSEHYATGMTETDQDEFCVLLAAQTDRVARLFGYESQPFIS